MFVFIKDGTIQPYETLPDRVRLGDGSTRTSLNELTLEQLEVLGFFLYQDVTPSNYTEPTWFGEIDVENQHVLVPTKFWDGTYIYDHEAKTIERVIQDVSLLDIKIRCLENLRTTQGIIQEAGYTTISGIKLQTDEVSLTRWTQLMVGLVAFQPPQVEIRDYNNIVHTVLLADASQMLAEVFIWGQTFLATTWGKKDAILGAESIQDLVELLT